MPRGIRRVQIDLRKMKRLERAVRRGDVSDLYGRQAAQALVDVIQANWSGNYPPASSPGYPPAIRTGNLKSAVMREKNGKQWTVRVMSDKADYALYLEYGTLKMAARPFVAPAVNQTRKIIRELAKNAVKKVIRDNT